MSGSAVRRPSKKSLQACLRRSATKTKTLRLFSEAELRTATSGFSTLLGRGSHGSVFLACLDNGRLLAAAKLAADAPSSFSSNEIAVLSSLPTSPFLVNLVGLSGAIAVIEFMPNGSLHDLIHRPSPRPAPPFCLRLRCAFQAAAALASLHALRPPVVHRDVKPSNILIDRSGRARLADFGLAVRGLPSPAAPAGTMGYLDPAYLSPADLSPKTDVYSFGVVLLELLTGRRALDVRQSPVSVVKWAARAVRKGRFDELWDPRPGGPKTDAERAAAVEVARLAARCVGSASGDRPAMQEVAVCLRSAGRMAGALPEGKCWWKSLARRQKVADVTI